jgi:hypothetical protein
MRATIIGALLLAIPSSAYAIVSWNYYAIGKWFPPQFGFYFVLAATGLGAVIGFLVGQIPNQGTKPPPASNPPENYDAHFAAPESHQPSQSGQIAASQDKTQEKPGAD